MNLGLLARMHARMHACLLAFGWGGLGADTDSLCSVLTKGERVGCVHACSSESLFCVCATTHALGCWLTCFDRAVACKRGLLQCSPELQTMGSDGAHLAAQLVAELCLAELCLCNVYG